jgi:hypothetical protein
MGGVYCRAYKLFTIENMAKGTARVVECKDVSNRISERDSTYLYYQIFYFTYKFSEQRLIVSITPEVVT